jgi:exopolysaccharide production protein ExoY
MKPHPSVPDTITLRESSGSLRQATADRHVSPVPANVAVAPARTRVVPRPRMGRYTATGEAVKEVTDRLLAVVGLVLVSPLLLAVAIAIRLDSKGPAIFRQVRLGRRGRPFYFYKFRGMYRDARERFPELYEYRYSAEQIRGLHFHSGNDPRVTPVGRFIRRTSLDELPNLINVVLGEMSLVGPRPEIPEMIPYYGESRDHVLSVKPGVTSLAKLVGRDNLDFADTLAMDVEYVRKRSLALDARILLATVVLVVTGRSAGF